MIWPNPDFDNSMTIYGPEVKALAGRYVAQMIDELKGFRTRTTQGAPCWTGSISSCLIRPTRPW